MIGAEAADRGVRGEPRPLALVVDLDSCRLPEQIVLVDPKDNRIVEVIE